MTAIDAAEVIIDLLQRGHAVEFRVRGDSMHPVIRENDSVHVEPGREIRRGDVVLTLATRGLTAHRVIAQDGQTIVTRGDNTPEADAPLQLAQVLGKVMWVERDGERRHVAREYVFVRWLRRIRRATTRQRFGVR
jgi:phage repressor protein C with HTH and peptisase S24 domain